MNEKIQDFFLNCQECVLENPRNFYGCFTLGPFKNSQGLTVANALRRTLLSELHGIAITYLEIDGAIHEYSTLSGVRESILDILLNFKHIVLRNTSSLKKPLFGYLNVRGPGIVRAADLKLPPIIQCVDPDQYIATLTENGKLNIKFTISDFQNFTQMKEISENFSNIPTFINNENFNFDKSKNQIKNISLKMLKNKIANLEQFYSKQNNLIEYKNYAQQNLENRANLFQKTFVETSSSTQSKAKLGIKASNTTQSSIRENNLSRNSLWVDPLFNPILKVNYSIETIQPIQNNIPNQCVRVELWTNGSIHPRQAFYKALIYLKTMFDKLESMKYLNYQFTNTLLESEKTMNKIFKTFEYDFQFYNSLEEKNVMSSTKHLFIPKEIQQIEKDYCVELLNQSNKNILEVPLEKLNFPSRLTKTLTKNKFFVIGDILKYTPKELKTFPGIGNVSISIIQKHFDKIGLKLEKKKINEN